MPRRLFSVDDPYTQQYSEIIDVRSPAEFDEDHVPGAINLPVLSNEERKLVGTVYKQEDAFRGRKLGAGIIAANIGTMLKEHFSTKGEGYHPLVYCWRGGQRSRSLATILSEIGWEVSLLLGGYKKYRAAVRDALTDLPSRFSYVVLTGLTGSAKSKLLEHLERSGQQVLHLERLARHQGSLLGALEHAPQPTQKSFEGELLRTFRQFDTNRVVWVEAESQKIGEVFMPSALRTSMLQSRSIEVVVPLALRVEFLLSQYPHFVEQPEKLKDLLLQLRTLHAKVVLEGWIADIDAGRWKALVASLLEHHYDPRYGKALARNYPNPLCQISIDDISETGLQSAAAVLVERDKN